MSSQEKSKELFEKYLSLIPVAETCSKCGQLHEPHNGARNQQAKLCALAAVEEIITFAWFTYKDEERMFWHKVKMEIDKL